MSHWKQYSNNFLKNTDMKTFEVALNNLGYTVDHNIKTVKNSYGHATVDMALVKNGKVLSLGFKKDKASGLLVMEGDPWLTGVDADKMMNQIAQQYNKENIVNKLRITSQYSVTDIQTNKKGEIEIMVACM